MSRRMWGILVLFLLSLALGVLSGAFYFKIWQKTVPPAVTTSFNTGNAHGYYLLCGAAVGVVFFAWGLLSPLIAMMFRSKKKTAKA